MKRNKFIELMYLYLTVFLVFTLSIVIIPFYINGDQYHYIRIYNGLLGLSLYEGYDFYKANIDSKEPVYFFLAWIFSNFGVEKIYFVSFFNSILAYYSYRFLNKMGGHPFIVFLIVSLSYYSLVLFFSAERLKFGLIFLIMALIYSNKRYIFYTLSLLAHAQTIIIIISLVFLKASKELSDFFASFKINKKVLLSVIVAVPIAIGIFVILQDHLLSKFNSYFSLRDISEVLKLGFVFVASLIYAKSRKEVFAIFLPLFFFTFIFGGERINILGYFCFLYFSIHYRKGFNLGVLFTILYFLYASFNFLLNIISLGDGFA